jgi:hypothetical protein
VQAQARPNWQQSPLAAMAAPAVAAPLASKAGSGNDRPCPAAAAAATSGNGGALSIASLALRASML